MIRRMGWLQNNAYLTRLAEEARAEYVKDTIAQT